MAILGGDTYQRVGASLNGITQGCAQATFARVVKAINRNLKRDFLYMPTEEMIRANAHENFQKYHLPNFGYSVDGMHVPFENMPRGLPLGRNPREFFNRKSRLTSS